VPNLSFVTDRLATGGDLPAERGAAAADLAAWGELGITHVIDARVEYSDAALVAELAPDLTYFHHGIDDAGQRIPDAWFDQGAAYATQALAVPGARLLVHCHMGVNRGPSLAFAALLSLGWGPVEAIDAIRTARPIAAVGYAEDALAWHHRRTGVTGRRRHADRQALAAWRAAHPLDVVRIIRQIRHANAS
jgi:hypothetical protein